MSNANKDFRAAPLPFEPVANLDLRQRIEKPAAKNVKARLM